MPIGNDVYWNPMAHHSLEYVEVYSLVVGLSRDCPALFGVPDYNVSVRSYGYATLLNTYMYMNLFMEQLNPNFAVACLQHKSIH